MSGLIAVKAYGSAGDGVTDDTAAIQAAMDAAGSFGTGVWFPPAAGGCYRTTGVSVPEGVTGLYGSARLSRTGGPAVTALGGSVLAPASGAVSSLLTIGAAGSASSGSGNPHGLIVDGLGFWGLTPDGTSITGMWGVSVTDTSDVTLIRCRDLYCGSCRRSPAPARRRTRGCCSVAPTVPARSCSPTPPPPAMAGRQTGHPAVIQDNRVGQWIGSDGLAVANTTTATLDLAAGPVLSH